MAVEVVTIKVGVSGDTLAIQNLQRLDTLIDQLNKKTVNIKIGGSSAADIEAKATAIDKLGKSIESISYNSNGFSIATQGAKDYKKAVESIDSTPMQKQIDALTGVSNAYKSAEESAKALLAAEKKLGTATGDRLDLKTDLSTSGMENYIRSMQNLQNATVTATKTIQVGDTSFQQFSVSAKNASGDIDNFTYSVDKTTGAVYKIDNGFSSLKNSSSSAGSAMSDAAGNADKFSKSTDQMGNSAKKAGQSVIDMMAKFAQWKIIGDLISAPVAAFKDAVQELKNVDSELVNIQKVLGASSSEMDRLSEKAYQVGSNLGVAASDYLASVTQWAQAGYGSLSDELGELSVMTQKVGDVDQATANQFLLSVDAAYQYQGSIESLTRVLDGANELSNNFATSVEKLAGGMGIVSSLAAQAGMAVEETAAAIGTITAVTQESGNSAARALRALILNIQGETNLEIDEVTGERWTEEEINKTAEAIQGLNVATREYKDGILQLRNPMEVIGEISEKYREGLISEVQLQELVSSLGGKTRSNQLQALITNFDMYEEQVETFVNATGSAERELDIYLNSWEAKANRVQNGWVQLVENMQTSDISKKLLDIANSLLEIANSDLGPVIIKITLLTAAITALALAYEKLKAAQAAGTLSELKGLPALLAKISKIDLEAIFTNAATAIKGATAAISGGGGFAAALSALSKSALATFGVVGLIVGVGVGIYKLVDYLNVTAEEQKELAVTAGEEYQSAAVEVENLNKQLEDTNKQISDLESKGKLSLTDQKDLQNLEEQKKSLEAQLAIAENIKKVKEETAVSETQQAIEKGFSQGWFDLGKEIGFNDAFDPSHIYEGWENQIGLLTDKLEEFRQKRDELSQKGDSLNWFEQKDLEDTNEDITALTSTLGEMASELQTYYDNLDGVTGEQADAIRSQIMSYLDAINYALDPVGTVIDKIDDALNNLSTDELQSFNDALNELRADGELTADEIVQLADTFPFLAALMDESGVSAQQLADYFLSAGSAAAEAKSDIERLKKILDPASELVDNALTAINNFEDIAGKTDYDDIYDKYGSAIKQFFEDYNEGIKNSQTLWAAAEVFFTPEQLEAMGWDIDVIAEKMASLATLFNGDPNNFLDQMKALSDAGKLVDEAGESLIELTETGFRIPIENMDEVAEKFGVTEEAFVTMLKYAGMFNEEIADIDLSGIEDYINDMGLVKEIGEEQVVNADELKKQLQEAGASGKDIAQAFEKLESSGYTVVSVTEEVEKLKNMLVDLGAAEQKNGKLEIRISNYAQLMDQLGYTKEQAAELLEKLYSAGNVSFVDTEGNTISLQQAIDEINTENISKQFAKSVSDANKASNDIKNAFNRALNYVNGLTFTPKFQIPDVELPSIFGGWTSDDSSSTTTDKKATGTNFANGGPTLLGDEQGVGPKPELVIDGDQAFLAGKNGPEVVNLSPGARVLTNTETKRALNGKNINGTIPALKKGSPSIGSDWNVDYKGETVDLTGGYNGSSSGSSSGSSGSGGSKASTVTITQKSDDGESYWDKQREALDEYLDALETATKVIEYEQEDSYQKQIANFQAAQAKIHATANDFRARGLKDTDNEIQELKLMWHEYADKIEDVYKAMYDDLKEMHSDDQWELDLLEKNRERADRSVVEIAADNQEIIASYKRMQQEVADLANYYRSQGYDETSDYIQDLSDAWWEYQEEIESVYENLTDSLDKYIETSKNKLEELERSGASVGERISVYIERIQKAQETLAALKFTNKNGVNDEAIANVQDQIWSDQDAIKDIQNSLWDELGSAIDVIFEEKQKEIDLIDKEIDRANKRIEQYQKELDDILNDPSITGTDVGINDLLERLNDNLEAEKDALESIVEPLENQINGYYKRDEDGNLEYVEGLTDKIEGYYKQDADGNLVYVEGLQDLLDAENERYNKEKEERDKQLQLEKKQLAVQEAIKNLQQAQLDLETAKNERPLYTLKDGVWAWRPDEEAIKNAQEAVEDAEQAKEDAENDLKDYEEDLKHQEIIDGLQDQIDAIEKQKEQINKQIDLYEKESKARQKYLQSQIDYWEKEKEAYEKHYDELIQAQEDIIAAKEEERDALKEDLEKWQEEWEEITNSLKEPVRDIKDILTDIAKYGTPAMQDAVNDVTDLLEQLGHALENFNPEYGGDNDWGNGDYMQGFKEQVIEKMKENSIRWHVSDEQGKEQLEREQQELGASIGAHYQGGYWYDENGEKLYDFTDDEMQEIIKRLMKQNSEAWHGASSSEQDRLESENRLLGDLIEAVYNEHEGKWYDKQGFPLFDAGGIARGLGVMQKATTEDEVVLSPALSNLVLTPQKNREFAQFAQSMGLLFGASQHFGSAEFSREAVSNNVTDRHDITINGVTIGESMLRRPLSDTLSLLGLHRNEY